MIINILYKESLAKKMIITNFLKYTIINILYKDSVAKK